MLLTEGCCRSETKDQRYVVKGDMFGPVAEAIFFRESNGSGAALIEGGE